MKVTLNSTPAQTEAISHEPRQELVTQLQQSVVDPRDIDAKMLADAGVDPENIAALLAACTPQG